MSNPISHITSRGAARIAGLMYLVTMATAVVSDMVVKSSLIIRGDAVRTAQNIAASMGLHRFGIVCEIATSAGVIVLVWALYVLLRPVNRDVALLAVFLRLVEVSLSFVMVLHASYAQRLLADSSYLQAIDPGHLQVLAYTALGGQGTAQTLMFFLLGLGSGAFSFLLLRSGYVPRALAALGIMGSLMLSAYALLIFAYPAARSAGVLPMLPLGVFEVTLGFWLLFGAGRIERRAAGASKP